MKRKGKPTFFIVLVLIIIFAVVTAFGVKTRWGDNTTTYIKGLQDIRWGIDIRGGVDVTFAPPEDVTDVTEEHMNAAEEVIKQRLSCV